MHQNDAPDEPSETTEEMMAAGSYGQEIQEDVTLEGLEGEDATHDARAPEERQHGSLNEKVVAEHHGHESEADGELPGGLKEKALRRKPESLSSDAIFGAGNAIRTRDILLGKEVLYH